MYTDIDKSKKSRFSQQLNDNQINTSTLCGLWRSISAETFDATPNVAIPLILVT